MALGKDPDAAPDDYAEVISASDALSARVLASVNSSWFGVRQAIRRVPQAVNLLGMVSVRMLAITQCLAAIHERVRLPERTLRRHWEASLVKAEAAGYLAESVDPTWADEAFLIGLMQDMVLPLMHRLQPDPYARFLEAGLVTPDELCSTERDLFGMDHAQAGAILARTMGLPGSLWEAIGHHHDQATLADAGMEAAVADAAYFAGLFPHMCTDWPAADAAAATAMIETRLAGAGSVDEALREISDRYGRLSGFTRPAGAERLDLPALLAEATAEIANTTTSLVGQVHSMMSNTTQVTSQLSAVNAEAIRLEEKTQTDALTGVLNRFGLEQAGAQMLTQIRQEHKSLTLAFADVDDFKSVNDRFGHDRGDQALKWVAATMQDVFGPTAMIGRYGGDEFIVLLGGIPGCEQANALGQKVVDIIEAGLCGAGGTHIRLGLSMGGIWCPVVPETADFPKLLVVVDELMYAAKADTAASVRIKAVVG